MPSYKTDLKDVKLKSRQKLEATGMPGFLVGSKEKVRWRKPKATGVSVKQSSSSTIGPQNS